MIGWDHCKVFEGTKTESERRRRMTDASNNAWFHGSGKLGLTSVPLLWLLQWLLTYDKRAFSVTVIKTHLAEGLQLKVSLLSKSLCAPAPTKSGALCFQRSIHWDSIATGYYEVYCVLCTVGVRGKQNCRFWKCSTMMALTLAHVQICLIICTVLWINKICVFLA